MSNTPKVTIADLSEFKADPANPNKGNARGRQLLDSSVKELGAGRSLVADKDGNIVAGNKTREALMKQGKTKAVVIEVDGDMPVIVQRKDMDLSDPTGSARKYAFMDNRAGELNLTWDDKVVIDAMNADLNLGGMWDPGELDAMLHGTSEGVGEKGVIPNDTPGALAARFVVPPFTVLDTRQGYWQDRKREWKAVGQGLVSDQGRDVETFADNDTFVGQAIKQVGGPASIFDPVLAEICYRWFNVKDGHILDPFAGGVVRGAVASMCGYPYTGVDLREEQVAVNRVAWKNIEDGLSNKPKLDVLEPDPVHDPEALTPVQYVGGIWFKRDDAFTIGAAGNGGKVRSCWGLAQGAAGLVTAGSTASPQVNIVAGIAQAMGIPCHVHTPSGKLGAEVEMAVANGAVLKQHKPGHNSVIIKRAKDDAAETGFKEIPFGMECQEAVDATRKQVINLPLNAGRLVMPVGSGMSLAGVLWGLKDQARQIPVLGIVVGADPTKRLDKYAPPDWRDMVTLQKSEVGYHDEAPVQELHGVKLDPIYEAKCIPFLKVDDCMWVVGRRHTAAPSTTPVNVGPQPQWVIGNSLELDLLLPTEQSYDMVFSCPPYYDLEKYSEDPQDLSNVDSYADFVRMYREIIRLSVAKLKPNRFACFVVGEIRGPDGALRNFVGHTVQAFEDAGATFVNEAVLLNSYGTASLRTRQFAGGRKLVHVHQNVLVFWKGDPRHVKDVMPPVEVGNAGTADDPPA